MFLEFLKDVIPDTLLDFVKLLPFLFLSYLLMEFLEHRAEGKMEGFLSRSGKVGPLFGGLLGVVPQCGFSAAASGLYVGRIITAGTLFAVFLSTSDEMLPILIAGGISPLKILKILAIKAALGILFGFAVDFALRLLHKGRADDTHDHVADFCKEEHCHCERGILLSALHHTLEIGIFLLFTVFALNTAVYFLGEETLSRLFSSLPVVGNLAAALIGLIPNCASSVIITQLYLEGVISAGCMFSGLLAGSGVGLLILFRLNRHHMRENFAILGTLYGFSVLAGCLIDLFGIGNWL